MFLLKFIFLLFIALFIFILLMAFRFISAFRDNINKFNRRSGDFGRQQWGQHRRTYGDDERVIDTRDPEEAGKKIFKKDEGEYVDYEEEP